MLKLEVRTNTCETHYTVLLDGEPIKAKVVPLTRSKALGGKGRGRTALVHKQVRNKPIVAVSVWRLPLLGNGDKYHVVWHRVEPKKSGFDFKAEDGTVVQEWVGIAR